MVYSPSISTLASSSEFRNSASRSISGSDGDARIARNGHCFDEPVVSVVLGSPVLSMSHEALALSLWRGPLCIAAAVLREILSIGPKLADKSE